MEHNFKLVTQPQCLNPTMQKVVRKEVVKLFQEKLKSKWSGPFTIKEVKPYGAVKLKDQTSK